MAALLREAVQGMALLSEPAAQRSRGASVLWPEPGRARLAGLVVASANIGTLLAARGGTAVRAWQR